MRYKKLFISFLSRYLIRDTWFKVRFNAPSVVGILSALLSNNKAMPEKVSTNEKIIVIGLGPSVLSFLNILNSSGLQNINVVSKDRLFGGKCVNYGCMPSLYSLSLGRVEKRFRREKVKEFIESLRKDVETQFTGLNCKIVTDSASHVIGKYLYLESGKKIKFDRLAIGIGSYYSSPIKVPLQTNKVIDIKDLWDTPPDTNLTIYSHDNFASVSVAEVANSMGVRVTLLLSGYNPLKNLPSFKYLIHSLKAKGINIFDDVRLIRVDDHGVSFERGAVIDTIPYDALLITSKPTPNTLSIDGNRVLINDIDLTTGSLPKRPDISFLGDSSGYFTASEAEMQSKMLAKNWIDGSVIDLKSLAKIPISLHGENSLAIVGEPSSLFEESEKWNEIDFKSLGWTKVSGLKGKLWYLYNKNNNKVEAIQICHPMACELISIASNLIDFPISDRRWQVPFTHPSPAEIFKIIVSNHQVK